MIAPDTTSLPHASDMKVPTARPAERVVPASELLAQPPLTWLPTFAAFAAAPGPLPRAADERARLVLLDCIGAIAAGMQEPELTAMAGNIEDSGPAPLIGAGISTSRSMAAFLGGAAGTSLELDEGNQFARGHPAIHVVPALLASLHGNESGAKLLTALAVGYEAGARIGIASRLRVTMHPHGTWGTVGAAVGVAALRGTDAATMARIINLAAGLVIASSRRTMLEGATVRNCFTGMANHVGVMAYDLAKAGFTGEADAVATVFGKVTGDGFDSDAMTAELGQHWEIARNYFKIHAACRYTHAALDIVEDLLVQRPLTINEIKSIRVDTYCWAAQLDNPAPDTTLAARFSIPFALATLIAHGAALPDAFGPKARANSAIAALARRVTVREDAAMTEALPDRRPARVTIVLVSGEVLEGEALVNRGDTETPYPRETIIAKFHRLAGRCWAPDTCTAIESVVADIDRPGAVSALKNLVSRPPRA